MKLVMNWLKKRLGYHVCEEFTQWERKKVTFTRPANVEDGWLSLKLDKITWTEQWLERRCTICGLVEQKKLKY